MIARHMLGKMLTTCLCIFMLAVAGCGGSNDTTNTGGPSSPPATGKKLPNSLCSLLPKATIEQVTGVTMDGDVHATEDGARGARQRIASCVYPLSDATFDLVTFTITIYDTADNANAIYMTNTTGGTPCASVAGLGDHACMETTKTVTLYTQKNTAYITIGRGPAGNLSAYPDQLKQLAQSVISQL
jgi:hypothetical protein